MGRPRLVLSEKLLRTLIQEGRMSIREVSRYLGCSRHVVRGRCEELDIEVLADTDAADLKRYLEPEPESQCLAGGCAAPARGFCPDHVGILAIAIEGRICASPRCPQSPRRGDPWCYSHEKTYGGSR